MGKDTWRVRYMMDQVDFFPLKAEYVDRILEIEQLSFPTPWSKKAFLSEVEQNSLAYYCVCMSNEKIIGYGGMWLIIDEAHITNVAVHPDFRGKKWGSHYASSNRPGINKGCF